MLEGGGNNLWGQVKVVAEVLDSLVCEVPVVMPPGKLFLDITARLERLERLHHLQFNKVKTN